MTGLPTPPDPAVTPVDAEHRLAYALVSRTALQTPERLDNMPIGLDIRDTAQRLIDRAGSAGPALRARARADLEHAAEHGAHLICPDDPGWPGTQLADLALLGPRHVPVALWARGNADLAQLTEQAVVVTGSRAATQYGVTMATELVTALARRGQTVLAGGGYGIDAAAHRAALAAGAATVAVGMTGIDLPYPAAHADLFDRIAESGLVVTEFPPGTTGGRECRQRRDWLLAALGQRFVVVEASQRSRTVRAAAAADLLNRSVFAVPGAITSAVSRGCHTLIAAGHATLATRVGHILHDHPDHLDHLDSAVR